MKPICRKSIIGKKRVIGPVKSQFPLKAVSDYRSTPPLGSGVRHQSGDNQRIANQRVALRIRSGRRHRKAITAANASSAASRNALAGFTSQSAPAISDAGM